MNARAGYITGFLLILAGIVAGVVIAVNTFSNLGDDVDGFGRLQVPGVTDVVFADGGEFTVYAETPTLVGEPLSFSVTRVSDDLDVPVELADPDLTYDIRGREGTAVLTFDLPAAGTYQLAAEGSLPDVDGTIAVGRSVAGDLLRGIVAALIVGLGLIVFGVLVLIVTAVGSARRPTGVDERSRDASRETGRTRPDKVRSWTERLPPELRPPPPATSSPAPVGEPEPMVESAPEAMVDSEPIVESAPEPMVDSEPIVESAAEPMVEAEPIVESAPEPIVESAPEPVVEAAEPMVDFEPIVESVPVPVVESEPIAGFEPEPVAESLSMPGTTERPASVVSDDFGHAERLPEIVAMERPPAVFAPPRRRDDTIAIAPPPGYQPLPEAEPIADLSTDSAE